MKKGNLILMMALVAFMAVIFIAGCGEDGDTSSSSDETVKGVVVDLAGRKIAGATVFIDATSTSDDDEYEVTTDDDGAFKISDVPQGTWTLTIISTGYKDLDLSVEVEDGTNTIDSSDITLLPAGISNLNGTVVNKSTGDPLTSVTLTIQSVSSTVTGTAVTDDNGAYSMENINSGQYNLKAVMAGYNSSTVEINLIEDINNTYSFKLSASSSEEEQLSDNVSEQQ